MADHDYDTMTDEELLQAAHAAGVDASAPPPAAKTAAPEGTSTAEKVGLGVAGAAAGALALKFPQLRTAITNLAERTKLEAPLWKQAGLRTAEDAPIARNLAGPSGMEALRLHTSDVSRTVAANEAGLPAAQAPILSQDILTDARRAPNSVYDRVERVLPPGSLDPEAQKAIQQAGLPATGRMSQGSPQAQAQIEALRQQLLDPTRQFTGQQMMNELRGLRQEGFTNVVSDDVSNQQLGRAQLDMARAIEGHVGRNIPAGADVTLDQFLTARKTLAKNFTVQSALRGGDVDLKALARAQRADPQVLDGGLKMLADFGETHPEVAALPTEATRYNPPGVARDVGDISLKSPATWVRPLLGAGARSSLTGDTDAAVAKANQMFPPRDAGSFSPPPQAPAPRFGGYLPAPSTVNAGGGATTLNTLDELGLTPDVRAAGAQHPATARLAALREQLSRPPMESIDFQGPQKWGDFSLTPGAEVAPALQADAVPFENVLEQGGTQGKPIAGIQSGYRPAPQSPKGPNMRTPPGAPELTEYTPSTPSDAQTAFRNQQAAARLRKVAGDLSVEGPGGNSGTMLDRLRAALERRGRGYAEGGAVIDFAKRGTETLMERIQEAFHNPYTADWQQLRQDISKYWTTAAPKAAEGASPLAQAAGTPPALLTPQKEPSLEDITRELNSLVNPSPSPAMADGGPVVLHPRQPLSDALARLAATPSAGADPAAQDDYLNRARTSVGDQLASRMRARAILDAQAASPPQVAAAHADGGPVDDTRSGLRRLADAARALDNPSGTDPNAEHRARVVANLASLVYGLDAQGKPAFGGRAWTPSQGGTPAGMLDALTATPHGLIQLATTLDKYLPGKTNPAFWSSIDPQWSQDAAQRLAQLKQRVQQEAGVGPPQGVGDMIADIATDPSMVAPMGAARVLDKSSALRKLLNTAASGTEEPAQLPAVQGAN